MIIFGMFRRRSAGRAAAAIETHVREFFTGHEIGVAAHSLAGQAPFDRPGSGILEIGPGPRASGWAYLTVGCWARTARGGHGAEFVMTTPDRDPAFADLLAMTAFYHCSRRTPLLDIGHSVPIGSPWTPGSDLSHFLVSLPYLHGPDLEHCPLPDGHARFLWLLPVTASEIAFRREHGTEALEQRFEDARINPLDPGRVGVV